jgi:hypothetical protein
MSTVAVALGTLAALGSAGAAAQTPPLTSTSPRRGGNPQAAALQRAMPAPPDGRISDCVSVATAARAAATALGQVRAVSRPISLTTPGCLAVRPVRCSR